MEFDFGLDESHVILKALKHYNDGLKKSHAALSKAFNTGAEDLGDVLLDVGDKMIYTEDLINRFKEM